MKKVILGFIVFVFLCVPIITAQAETIVDKNDATTENRLTGWVKENGKTYYYEKGEKVKGFKEINGNLYFLSGIDGALTSGWKQAYSQTWYQDKDGIVRRGLQEIDGKKYYFNKTTGYRESGFKTIDGVLYFFSSVDGYASRGWKKAYGNTWYQDETGAVLKGLQEIDGKKYYFNEKTGYCESGFKELDGVLYFFSSVDGSASRGWKKAYSQIWYQDETGAVLKGLQEIDGKKYYFNEKTGYRESGFKELDGVLYFFSSIDGSASRGWKKAYGNTWYQDETGAVLKGLQEIDGKKYFLNEETGYRETGEKEINGKLYYFNEETGEVRTGKYNVKGNKVYYDDFGYVIKIQYIPKYYSQRDKKWTNTYYGKFNMKSSGCAPTALAMAFERILGRKVLPTDVASYLYKNTTEFNRPIAGASGLAIKYAANHFGVKWKGLSKEKDIIEALSEGKIVFANVGPGKFTKPGLTHAIVLYKNENKYTYAMDPYNSNNNGKISIREIWQQKSSNPYDLRGGYAFYALG